MGDERFDRRTMIGLHKVFSRPGDELVPELFELLSSEVRPTDGSSNVAAFPAWAVRPPRGDGLGIGVPAGDNILPFPSGAHYMAKMQEGA